MPRLKKRVYESREELGQELQALVPKWRDLDPLEVADKFVAANPQVSVRDPGPQRYGDISPARMAGNALGDVFPTLGEEVSGMTQAVLHPIDTTVALGKVLGGAADLNLGTDIAAPESEAAARAVWEGMKQEFSPAGLEQRPVRAAVDVVSTVSPKAILGALSKASKAARAGRAGRVAARATRAGIGMADALHSPGRTAVRGVRGTGRATGRAFRKGMDTVGRAATGGTGETLTTQAIDAMLGFTTNAGEREIHNFLSVVNAPGPQASRMRRAFEATRNGLAATSPPDVVASIQNNLVRDMTIAHWRKVQAARERYARGMARIPELNLSLDDLAQGMPGGMTGRDLAMDLRTRIQAGMVKHGIDVKPVIDAKTRRVKGYRAIVVPGYEGIPDMNGVRGAVQTYLNASFDTQTGKTTLGHLNTLRQNLDQSIEDALAAVNPPPTVRHLSALRTAVAGFVEENANAANPRFGAINDIYKNTIRPLQEIQAEFGLPTYAVRTGQKYVPGGARAKRNVTFNAAAVNGGTGPVFTRIIDSFRDTSPRRFRRGAMLAELEGSLPKGADPLVARISGINFSDMMAGGLVARGQLSGAVRAGMGTLPMLAGAGAGAALGGTLGAVLGALGGSVATSILYSPRLSSTLAIALAKYMEKPPNPGVVRRLARTMNQNAKKLLGHKVAGPIIRNAIAQGWSWDKTLEALQARGVDVEGELYPERRKKRRGTMLRSLGRR